MKGESGLLDWAARHLQCDLVQSGLIWARKEMELPSYVSGVTLWLANSTCIARPPLIDEPANLFVCECVCERICVCACACLTAHTCVTVCVFEAVIGKSVHVPAFHEASQGKSLQMLPNRNLNLTMKRGEEWQTGQRRSKTTLCVCVAVFLLSLAFQNGFDVSRGFTDQKVNYS